MGSVSPAWDCEAIVVGSGFAGAVTACRLTEVGWSVCIIERGRRYGASDLPVLPATGSGGGGEECPEGSSDRVLPDYTRALWKLGHGLWDLRDLGEMVVAQAAGWGGGSLIYANVHLRAPDEVFRDWPSPYCRSHLDSYYDLAAYMLDVEPVRETLPKTGQLERTAAKLGRVTFRPPLAINFGQREKNHLGLEIGQGVCDMRGECCFGCSQQAKNTLDLNYLALAERAGADVRTMAEVFSIRPTRRDGGNGYEVTYRDHLARGRSEVVRAPFVFLCAGAVNTTELLLRNREHLPLTGRGLGDGFYPNVDELAVIFDTDDRQDSDRGPTITSSLIHDDGESWLLVQDGGMPTHLEPLLGIFRSPLWLHRNGFSSRSGARAGTSSQRVARAKLPFDALLDALSGLTGSAVSSSLPLAHDVSQAAQAYVLRRHEFDSRRHRQWRLQPDQLKTALSELREGALAEIALLSEPVLDDLLDEVVQAVEPGLRDLLEGLDPGISPDQLARWSFRLGVQQLFGHQAGMIGAVARMLRDRVLPEQGDVLESVARVLRWALDYRLGDGHSTLLLSMGRDSRSWQLGLESRKRPAAGARVRGATSGATGVVVCASKPVLVLVEVEGEFELHEVLLADGRAFGLCDDAEVEALPVEGLPTDSASAGGAGSGLRLLRLLRFAPLPDRAGRPPELGSADECEFRSDDYWRDGLESASGPAAASVSEPPLRVRQRRPGIAGERDTQQRLLRDIARGLGGELRTDPLWSALGRRVTVHSQGGCAMAASEDRGVTDPDGHVFGCPGLIVMDAAAFPGPVGVNPSATIAAVAEHKIARFIRTALPRRGSWEAEHQRVAGGWADERRDDLDPIAALRRPRAADPAPRSRPIGIAFEEVMRGTHTPRGGTEERVETHLTAAVPSLATFLDENRRGAPLPLELKGTILFERADGIDRYPVDERRSRIWFGSGSDEQRGEWRTIEYWLEFEASRVRWILDGKKVLRDDQRFDAWEDTTTLKFSISRQGHLANPLSQGILRLPASEFFAGQMRSLRATGIDDDPARQLWALASFSQFFFGHLVDVYVPALDRMAEVAQGLAKRGHV